jgi:hypothetical protein
MSSAPSPRPSITENPWFWLMLFGGMGILAVTVIGPKHAARQARLERMAETRQRVAAARDAGLTTAAVATQRSSSAGSQVEEQDAEETGPIEPYVETDFRRPPRLNWLLIVTTLLMLVGTAGLLITRRRVGPAAPTPSA